MLSSRLASGSCQGTTRRRGPRFGFIGGALTQVTIEIRHDSPQGEAVFAIQQLVVLLAEQFGTASSLVSPVLSQVVWSI